MKDLVAVTFVSDDL